MSGGGTSTNYQMPWQQQQMLQALLPMFEGMASYGLNNQTRAPGTYSTQAQSGGYGGGAGYGGGRSMFGGGRDYGSPIEVDYGGGNVGGYGGGYGAQSSEPVYTQGAVTDLYQQPSAPQPTADWFNSISPEVMAGLWEPYDYAANQMAEQLNYSGALGAGGQYTGNAMDNFGDFYSKAGTQLGLQAWNLMSPGLIQDYNAQLQELMMPYQMMGILPQMMPTGVVQNQSNSWGNAAGGAMGGAALGGSIGGPYGAAIGGIGGALAGLLA